MLFARLSSPIMSTEEKPQTEVADDQQQVLEASELLKNPQILAAVQNQLNGLIGTNSGYLESLPKNVRGRINALKNIQVEFAKIEGKFYEEAHMLEMKYAELFKPLYDKRKEIVNALYEPSEEETKWVEPGLEDNDEEEDKEEDKSEEEKLFQDALQANINMDENTKGVPEFWLTAMKNVEIVADMIKRKKEEVKQIPKSRTTKTKPFNFQIENRIKRRHQRNEKTIEEEKLHEFDAQLLPTFSPDPLPAVAPKHTTNPVPFKISTGSQAYEDKMQEKRKKEEATRAQREFRAKPANHCAFFRPATGLIAPADIDFTLHTDAHPKKRQKFEEWKHDEKELYEFDAQLLSTFSPDPLPAVAPKHTTNPVLEKPVKILTTRRCRKNVERLTMEESIKKSPPEDAYDYAKGKGVKLGDIPYIKHMIKTTTTADLKSMHHLLFYKAAKANTIKKNILSFCGYPFGKETLCYQRAERFCSKHPFPQQKSLCDLLGLKKLGRTKKELKERLMKFLQVPLNFNKPLPNSSRRKKKQSKRVAKSVSKTTDFTIVVENIMKEGVMVSSLNSI